MWKRILGLIVITLAAGIGVNYSLELASQKSPLALLGVVAFFLCFVIWFKLLRQLFKKFFLVNEDKTPAISDVDVRTDTIYYKDGQHDFATGTEKSPDTDHKDPNA